MGNQKTPVLVHGIAAHRWGPWRNVARDESQHAVFISNRDINGKGALTRILDGKTDRVITGVTAEGLALDEARHRIFVGNVNDGTVLELDSRTLQSIRRIPAVTRTFGIALGMGTLAAVNMFSAVLLANLTGNSAAIANLVRGLIFMATQSAWIAYFMLPARNDKPIMVPIASPLMRWNEVAAAIGHPAGRVMYVNGSNPEPFLPQVERMVEEVMRRRVN